MNEQQSQPTGDRIYEEREAVAIFDDETSLNNAVDALMQAGLREDDLSLLVASKSPEEEDATAAELADKDFVTHADYVSPDSRVEGLAALVGVPIYVAGAGTAAFVATGGVALVPIIAVVAGTGLAAGVVGLILARIFGRHHSERVQAQIAKGGLLLWVRMPEAARDATVLDILRRTGAHDVHLHVVKRTWGASDVPMHDVEPDPFLR